MTTFVTQRATQQEALTRAVNVTGNAAVSLGGGRAIARTESEATSINYGISGRVLIDEKINITKNGNTYTVLCCEDETQDVVIHAPTTLPPVVVYLPGSFVPIVLVPESPDLTVTCNIGDIITIFPTGLPSEENASASPPYLVFVVESTLDITDQPDDQEIYEGETATFSVSATISDGLASYQWQKNGVDIPGATSASYTTPAEVLADDGATFRCVVGNGFCEELISDDAVLTVTEITLEITLHPQSQTVDEPSTATFTVAATTNYGTLSYQWKKNGVNVGTNSTSYTTGATTYGQNDVYYCVVSNGVLTENSNEATLTVQRLTLVGTYDIPPGGYIYYLGGGAAGVPQTPGKYRVVRNAVGNAPGETVGFINSNYDDGRLAGASYTIKYNGTANSILTSGSADIWYFTGTINDSNVGWVNARNACNELLNNTYVEFIHTSGKIQIGYPYSPDPNFPLASGAQRFTFYRVG